jgi:hypothetical protein
MRTSHHFAYVAVENASWRSAISETLKQQAWRVELRACGFDLLEDLCDLITNERPAVAPDLLVIDRLARGCAGTTIAFGLRDLGVRIPIVLVGASEPTPASDHDGIVQVSGPRAATVIARLVRPAAVTDPAYASRPRGS